VGSESFGVRSGAVVVVVGAVVGGGAAVAGGVTVGSGRSLVAAVVAALAVSAAAAGSAGFAAGGLRRGFFFFGSAFADFGSASGRLDTLDEAIPAPPTAGAAPAPAGALVPAATEDAAAGAPAGAAVAPLAPGAADAFTAGFSLAAVAVAARCAFAARVRSMTTTATIAPNASAIGTTILATLAIPQRGFTICESSGPGASGVNEGREDASATMRIDGPVGSCVSA